MGNCSGQNSYFKKMNINNDFICYVYNVLFWKDN